MAKAKEVEKKAVETAETVMVTMVEAKEGTHTVFTKKGKAEFKDGEAVVAKEVVAELKELGLVK